MQELLAIWHLKLTCHECNLHLRLTSFECLASWQCKLALQAIKLRMQLAFKACIECIRSMQARLTSNESIAY